ncbi:MAG: response regulator transcription factor [Bacteroidales bacterium]|jgi:two-component system LytT family response regulator|nr:response regulator transcription factor [Bacteroidales bacterium]
MKALIIEDELMAAKTLKKLLGEVSPDTEIVGVLESIEDSVDWISQHPMPDLIFMDIHLADGSSFTIFDRVTVTCPVIFTTAYDEYALKAFEVNSIDYLLKPISKEALERAVAKYHNLGRGLEQQQLEALLKHLGAKPKFKSCFLLPERDKLVPLPTSDIAYAYIDTKTVKLVTFDDKTFYMNQTLDDILAQLDPQMFFRANRQFLISRNAVKDVSVWFGNKLAINLTVETPEKVIVSKARVAEFKAWFVS